MLTTTGNKCVIDGVRIAATAGLTSYKDSLVSKETSHEDSIINKINPASLASTHVKCLIK